MQLRFCALTSLFLAGLVSLAAAAPAAKQVFVPGEARFSPYAITVHVGQTVEFVSQDADTHNVISIDAFNTAGHKGFNHLLKHDSSFKIKFTRTGVFPFYCGFHAMLDADNQPKAPGPNGGIQDPDGNYGTPMVGVVTVIP
jgi:plastocyanin